MHLNHQKIQKFYGKCFLGIDMGSKKTGLALFKPGIDPFVQIYDQFSHSSEDKLIKRLEDVIHSESIEILVIGVPYLTDGTSSTQTKKIKKIIAKIQSNFSHLKIFEQDETLSTYEAEERMKNSPKFNFQIKPEKIDSLSAQIILEDFFS